MRLVAIGDSVTEGIGDPRPDGSLRGWADRLAEGLAVHHGEVEYANLAVRGLEAAEIRAAQLGAAIALEPDLVTAVVGMNDLVQPSLDTEAFGDETRAMFATLAASVPTVVTATLPDVGQVMPVPPVVRRSMTRRVAHLNAALERQAAAFGVLVLDLARIPDATAPSLWSADRLHPNPAGHAMLAAAALELLGVLTDRAVTDPEPDLTAADAGGAAAWFRRDLGPWVWRRLTGRSSSAGASAKQPSYRVVVSHDARGVELTEP